MRARPYEAALVLLFLLTLPLSNPWVRGDGVGYYAFARSLLIEHRLDFREDWQHANLSFRLGRTDLTDSVLPNQYTPTGHLNNHFSIGPAVLWSPFLLAAHAGVLLYDRLGGAVAADGFSRPYVAAMALGTACYGFLALLISFRLARRLVSERWAFLATLGIWFGSSLPVYMYFNPSWSHAQSAFVVAVFLAYWLRTRGARGFGQWIILGALGGLMMDVYYMNAVLLLLPLWESLGSYGVAIRNRTANVFGRTLELNAVFSIALLGAFLPTLIAKEVIYGSFWNFGYTGSWFWRSPAFFKACFSSDHGLFSWTPILIPSVAGIFCLRRYDRILGLSLAAAFVAFLYLIGCYQNWDGLSSYGNRFFVSLTSLFILGLAAFLGWLDSAWGERRASVVASAAGAGFVLWNLGLIFQWGLHLIPPRGPISWPAAAHNQVSVVPAEAGTMVKLYLIRRRRLMDHIEQTDVKSLQSEESRGTE